MYKVCEEHGLECHSMEGVSCYAVGLSPMDMGQDETRKQFENRVEQTIKEVFKLENIDPGWIEEAYYS